MSTPIATPSSFSDKNPVHLSDWWLTEVEPGSEGKKLGVCGFTIRKQAMRLFNSAAIVKRFDAYSLETADGNSIIIEGMINKDRTCTNGFSVEVCNRFLIGFPSNWEYYATEYFQNKSLQKDLSDSTQTAGTSYPAYPDGSSIDRICNWFSSADCTVTDGFKNELEEFLKSTPTEPMIQAPNMINNPQRADATCPIDDFHGDVSSNTILESCGEKNQHEGQKIMLMKTPLQSIRETEVTCDIERSTSVNHGDCDDIQVLREEESIIGSINSVVTSNTGVRKKSRLLKELDISLSKDEQESEDATERQHDVEEMQTCKTPFHSTKNLLSTNAVQHDASRSLRSPIASSSTSGVRTRSGRVLGSSIASSSLRSGRSNSTYRGKAKALTTATFESPNG